MRTVLEKAMRLQLKKINLRQDNYFRLEGQIKNILHTKDLVNAVMRLHILDTHAH